MRRLGYVKYNIALGGCKSRSVIFIPEMRA